MGLYDDRLADLGEARNRVAQRRPSKPNRNPMVRPRSSARDSARADAPRRPVQSLLFDRSAGWTVVKAKSWAKAHGYVSESAESTDQYVRIRQSGSKSPNAKRTVPFGRGIRAVVAREVVNSMATAKEARRKRRPSKKKKTVKRRKRTVRRAATAAPKRRRRRARASESPRRRRRPAQVMEASRRRRRRRVTKEAWRGDSAGHAKAARKGWRRKKRKSAAPKRRRRRTTREAPIVAASRRRRRRSVSSSGYVMASRRRRRTVRSGGVFEKRGSRGMQAAELAVALISGGLGFVLADGLDRFLATYNPAGTGEIPKDKFTSPDGAGTLANTLNVAATPSLARIGAGIGIMAVPTVGAMYVKNPMLRSSLEGAALGAGISLFKTIWNNVVMGYLLKPKDTSVASLQKSYVARLYPAEVAAAINLEQKQTAVSSSGSGALSGPSADVGPFALSGDSPYPSVEQALNSGVQDYPTVQNTWGTGGDSEYPTVAQTMGVSGELAGIFDSMKRAGASVADIQAAGRAAASAAKGVMMKCVTVPQTGVRDQAGVSDPWQPGPPPGPGPGPQPDKEACACLGDGEQFASFLGDAQEDSTLLINV